MLACLAVEYMHPVKAPAVSPLHRSDLMSTQTYRSLCEAVAAAAARDGMLGLGDANPSCSTDRRRPPCSAAHKAAPDRGSTAPQGSTYPQGSTALQDSAAPKVASDRGREATSLQAEEEVGESSASAALPSRGSGRTVADDPAAADTNCVPSGRPLCWSHVQQLVIYGLGSMEGGRVSRCQVRVGWGVMRCGFSFRVNPDPHLYEPCPSSVARAGSGIAGTAAGPRGAGPRL